MLFVSGICISVIGVERGLSALCSATHLDYRIFYAAKDTGFTDFGKKADKMNWDTRPFFGAVFSIAYAIETGCYAITNLFLSYQKTGELPISIEEDPNALPTQLHYKGMDLSISYSSQVEPEEVQEAKEQLIKSIDLQLSLHDIAVLHQKTDIRFPLKQEQWISDTGFCGGITATVIRTLSYREKAALYGELCVSNIVNICTLGIFHFVIARNMRFIYALNGSTDCPGQI